MHDRTMTMEHPICNIATMTKHSGHETCTTLSKSGVGAQFVFGIPKGNINYNDEAFGNANEID